MFYDALSNTFENVLTWDGDHRLGDRIVTWPTVEEWSKKLVETHAEAARLNGGWEYWPGQNEAHTNKVFLIRVGSGVFGCVEVANARRSDGKGWKNGIITLKELKFLHRDIYKKYEQSELPAMVALLKKPKGLEQDPEVEPSSILHGGLDLV